MPAGHLRLAVRKSRNTQAVSKRAPKHKARIVRDGKKVLVVDDTETLRVFVEEMLSAADPRMQIETAANGTEGLSQSASFRPDLILLDYSLPDINGDEVCRRLLDSEQTDPIPVIMMSGHVAEMAAAAALYENIVLTLPKPFLSAALIDAVLTILAKPPIFKFTKPNASPAKIQAEETQPPAIEKSQEATAPRVSISAGLTPSLPVGKEISACYLEASGR